MKDTRGRSAVVKCPETVRWEEANHRRGEERCPRDSLSIADFILRDLDGPGLLPAGSQLVQFALVWWLTKITGSATVLAFATMMALLAQIVLGPAIMRIQDRPLDPTVTR